MENLTNKVTLITGGGRGLGSAICLALARQGADVVVNYLHSGAGARQVTREIEKMGSRALAVKADISRSEEVQDLVNTALHAFGRIDVLVNNAGVFPRTPFGDISEEEWDRTMDVNLKGVFLCSQAVAPSMLKQGRGRIINLASLGGIKPWPNHLPYCVSKAGVIMATKCLALALAPQVQVNCIAPGIIGLQAGLGEETCRRLHARTPAGKFGDPGDVAEMVLYLATCCDFVTGQVLSIDGGLGLR